MKIFLLILLMIPIAQAERFVVEASHRLTPQELRGANGLKIERFSLAASDYLSRLYIVSGNKTALEVSKLAWVNNVEQTHELSPLSLLPSENPLWLVGDDLFPYQWGLLNQGQTFIREKDDIHNLPMKGLDGKDVGWRELLPKLSGRPVVAVLDSGVDLNHPDLKDNLWKNEKECGLDSNVDHDGNQLPGDCMGWNFTEDLDSLEAKNPQDIDGHGTHVAGIIAALHNDSGIVGVAPNALIMPIKVMKDSFSKSEIASSESFARGIIYAADNGAQVINMSLGWPRSLETKYLRESVLYALSKGAIIVAAAGNNNSSEPLFPCAYEGVVCAGASTLSGEMAGFSNFGGHVDTVAPGEGILSLSPIMFEPEFFSVPGYDVKSGTSQSAPFVTGLIAALIGQEKGISATEIFARLYQGRPIKDPKKYVLGGALDWNSLATPATAPVIRPILKRVRQLTVRNDGSEIKLTIPLKNYGTASEAFEVKVTSLSRAVAVHSSPITVSGLAQGQAQDAVFTFNILDMTAESNITLKITITEGEKASNFLIEIPVVRDIRQESSFKKKSFSFLKSPIAVGGVKNGEITTFLNTVEAFAGSTRHEFYLKRLIPEGEIKKLEITLFSRLGDSYQEAPQNINISNVLNLVNFIRVDLNFDGKEDYLVHTLAQKDGKKFFQFSFYDAAIEPLWPNFQDVQLELDLYLESMNELSFTRFEHPALGTILVPAFFTIGQLPRIDQLVSSWEKLEAGKKERLYYLEPLDKKFRVRSLTTKVWEESIKKELNSKWFETVEVERLLPTSVKDAKEGTLRAIVSVGELTKRNLFIYSFNTKRTIHGQKLPQLVLQTDEVDPLFTVSNLGLKVDGDVYLNIYDRSRAKIVMTKDLAQSKELIYRHESETDLLAGHLASFESVEGVFSVLQTRDSLIGIFKTPQTTQVSTRAKLRYSFLSQKLLSEMYFPVSYKRGGQSAGALYVDATSVTGNRLYLFEEQKGELISSIQNSLLIPNNCHAHNPSFSESSQTYEFIFLCLEDKQWAIRTFEMN